MLREGQRQKDEAVEPRPEEGTPTSSIIAPHDSAERAGDDDTKPFRDLEQELTARMGPPPPRVKRKVARPRRQPAAEAAPEEETPEEETPQDGTDSPDQTTGQVPARTAARTPARTPAKTPAQPEERTLTFTPAVFTPLPSPPSPWSYVAGAAAVLFVVLAGWRLYEANEAVAPKAAVASVSSEEVQPPAVPVAQPVAVASAQPVTVAAAQPVARPAAQPPSAASVRAAEWLLNKARVLIGQGEIGAARAVLEQATEAGGAPALFALAETYDPAVLARWGTVGTLGDVARARELYGLALAAGAPEARARLMALP